MKKYMAHLEEIVKDKRVLFITTKNIDYIRNTQELRAIKNFARSVDVIYSEKKNYAWRIPEVWRKITKKKINNSDVIFVGFEPQFVIPFVGWRFKGKTVVIDFFISVYDTLICDRKKFRDGGIVAKLSRWMDITTIKNAVHIITDTKTHAMYFETEFEGEKEKFETIYLEADSKIYYPRPQNKPANIKDKFVVLYFGSILPLQGVDIVLSAIQKFENRDDIYFDIIGPIPDKYNKPIQDNVHYTEWLPQAQLAEHIANADLCLAGHFHGTIGKANRTIPGKAYIYEMMNKKMVLGDSEANHELFKEDDKHFFVKLGDIQELQKLIESQRKFYERI